MKCFLGCVARTDRQALPLLGISHERDFSCHSTKRLIKAPKIYFTDPGLAAWLIGIHSVEHLRTHPLRGAIFENVTVLPWQGLAPLLNEL